jgi:hypothetical protein
MDEDYTELSGLILNVEKRQEELRLLESENPYLRMVIFEDGDIVFRTHEIMRAGLAGRCLEDTIAKYIDALNGDLSRYNN